MSSYVVQVTLVFILTFLNAHAKKPPGYVAPPKEYDPNPPNYEYGYRIQEDKVTQGKDEQRDGIYAKGRYYVENGTDSSQDVKYFADDWGYHTVVNYTNTGPHSKSNANFAFGEEALKLKNNQKFLPNDPSDPGKADKTSTPESSSPTSQPSVVDNQLDPSTSLEPAREAPLQFITDPGNTLDSQILIPENQQFSPSGPNLQFLTHPLEYQQLNDPQTSQHQPIFFYVQPQLAIETQFYSEQPNQLVQLLQNNQNPPDIQNYEPLPKPEALVSPNSVEEKSPNQLDYKNKEYGSKLNPKHTQLNKLIESTRNLVSGDDVLNINAAISQNQNSDIESGTLASLLKEYVTPTILNNHIDVDINIISSTTPASFLKQPIIVAEESKPVTEKTDENDNFMSSTARSTIAATQKPEDNHVLVTPRPSTVSSRFLAPITAGVQLEQNVEDSKTVNIYEQENKVSVQVQKTIPYYLGMYEYPSGFDNPKNTSEQKAVENIELGKTLLYFPEQDSPKAEALIATEQPQIISNDLVAQQQNEAEQTHEINIDQQGNGIETRDYIQERPSYSHTPITKIVEKPVHVPIEITKYIDRPYPVEVPVPVPQPYPVEKIVKQIVKEPYPVHVKVPVHVEKIVERKIPVPYYIEKPAEKPQYGYEPFPLSSQALLVQVPGLFTQQKYSSLVQNSYAPQNNHYLPPNHQNKQNSFYFNPKGRSNNNNYKLKKLNLLVLPRQNILNLPPITKNPHDLVRHSNAQLNNGYLPPDCNHNNGNLEASASIANAYKVNKPEDHIGLIPPKRPLFEEARTYRQARQFDDKSIRMEYGFMPPLVPSLEIDMLGQPIEKN